MVTIIDYGIGNLRSIEKAFQSVGIEVLRTDQPEDIAQAEHLVLPGVGAFGACIGEIRKRNLEAPILEYVAKNKPFLGVCIGMQLLFEFGEEMGTHRGLGILPGRVIRFSGYENTIDSDACDIDPVDTLTVSPAAIKSLKIPHMGWNTVIKHRDSPLLRGIEAGAFFYFVHSFHASPEDPQDVLATTEYGVTFPAIVNRNNVFGVQFHPEKSQQNGLRILKNFSEL